MARGRNNRKTSPVHRIGLTHGREGVPKFIRENTDQFFAAATRRKSKIASASKPIISTEFQQQQQYQSQQNNNDEKQENLFTTSITKSSSSMMLLPPIRTGNMIKSKVVPSASVCFHQPSLHSFMPSPSDSLESSTPILKSSSRHPLAKRPFCHAGPVDQDIFRKAYERALSVARSRLLFRDPYSLTRASATHGILYSYYDHTPMCIFSRGTACDHRQDKTNKSERKTKSNLSRKKIFNDVIVEHYIS